MPEEMFSSELSSKTAQKRNENNNWSKVLIVLIFFLMSFLCIFCSSQSALWFIDRGQVEAKTISGKFADYSQRPRIVVPPVDAAAIAAEKAKDDQDLERETVEPLISSVVPLEPLDLPARPTSASPSPTIIVLAPTSTPTPIPTSISEPEPSPTSPPPAPTPPPPTVPPTSAPPTPEPTSILPTLPPTNTPLPPPTNTPLSPPTNTPLPPPTNTPLPPPTNTPLPPPTNTPLPLPIVTFSNATYSVNEANGTATITVVLNSSSTQTITVDYSSSNGSAIAGNDYTTVAGTLTFAPGQTSQTFTIPIINDSLDELDKTIQLTLGNPTNATLGSIISAILTIVDNDAAPTVRFSQPSYNVAEDNGPAIITVTLSEPSSLIITVNYATSDNTASAGSDYLTSTGTLIFAPGQTILTFTITLTDDGVNEPDETALLTLGNPGNATLGAPSNATLIIADNDTSIIRFDQPDYAILENGGSAVITTTLTPTAPVTVTVDYNTANLTATAGKDYTTASNTLTFPPGTTSLTFTVTILNDALQEPDETALLKLSNVNGAILGTDVATLTISDDGDISPCITEGVLPDLNEPDIGLPDGSFIEIICNSASIIDLGGTPIDTSIPDASFDFVYYEFGQPNPPTDTTFIYLDWLIVEVAPDISGPWYQVFYWGNTIIDTNTNIGQAGFGPTTSPPLTIESDNEVISTTFLYGTAPYTTGIAIDIDAVAPPNIYRYVRFSVPNGGDNDTSQVDAIEILP